MKRLITAAALLVLGITANPLLPQVAKADPPYVCATCAHPWNIENTLYYIQLLNGLYNSPLQYTGTAINEDEWNNNIVWTDVNIAKPDWFSVSDPSSNDMGYEWRMLRPFYQDPTIWEETPEVDTLETRMDDAEVWMMDADGIMSAMESDITTLQGAMPDDLGDLAAGSDSNHFTDAEQTKLGDLPTAAQLTTSFNDKFNNPAGTTAQYLRGNGTVATFPTTLPPAAHTHPATDISDSTSVGRSVLTASSQANARTAIGAGTSNFSGSYLDLTNLPAARSESSVNRSSNLTTSTGAAGFQISSTRWARACYSYRITSTIALLSGNQNGQVNLEVAATNSATAGDWVVKGAMQGAQGGTLVVGLSIDQNISGQVCADVPPGYYVKLRSISTGTPTYTYLAGSEVLM